jgi:hypothetical protein
VIAILFFTCLAHASCELGNTLQHAKHSFKNCAVIGHQGQAFKVYYVHCENLPKNQQIEYAGGASTARLLDSLSRETVATCKVKRTEVAALVDAYSAKSSEIENPKCYLTRWKGQMMFVANGVKGRCSFKMNPQKATEFKTKTGMAALYQCESDHYLVAGDNGATTIYNGFSLECPAAIRVGESVDPIDWKNPPDYYEPEQEVPGPKSGSP